MFGEGHESSTVVPNKQVSRECAEMQNSKLDMTRNTAIFSSSLTHGCMILGN
jgi:hypothetical protein